MDSALFADVQGEELTPEELEGRKVLVLDALEFLMKKKHKRVKMRTEEIKQMEDHIEKLANDAWKGNKFFPYRTSLDWRYTNSICKWSAFMLGFPLPKKEGGEHEPEWWKVFRKYINSAISNKRGHCIDEIKKK